MLRDYLTKRKTFRKTVKAAVKEEVKSRVTAARAQELFEKNAEQLRKNDYIESELYVKNNVKRGLRNSNGTGVLVGLTKIGEVIGYDVDEKKNKIPGRREIVLPRLQHRRPGEQLYRRRAIWL